MDVVGDLSEERQPLDAPELAIEEVRGVGRGGREQGYLNADHVHDTLQDVDLTTDQIDNIFILFNDLGIDILEGDDTPGPDGPEAKAEEEGHPQARPLGQDADQRPGAHVPQGDRQGAAPHRRRRGLAGQAHRASRHGGQAQAHRGQPAPRGVHRQALRRPRHALPRPHPGGQPGPDTRVEKFDYRKGTSSRPTRRGGSARRSRAPIADQAPPSASRCTWSRPSTS